jgi:hypothetical protein
MFFFLELFFVLNALPIPSVILFRRFHPLFGVPVTCESTFLLLKHMLPRYICNAQLFHKSRDRCYDFKI